MHSYNISDLKYIFIIIIFIVSITDFIIIYINKRDIYVETNKNININNEFLNIEGYNSEILLPIQNTLKGYIEITHDEQKFLNGIIRKIKPKKIVEIGVAYGGIAVIILNAIKDIEDAKLYSIDINKNCYKKPSKHTGFIVKEKFPHLADKWQLYTGGYTSQFIEKIGNNIDLVYIDTVHVVPGEMLNWLEILPFLKEESFVILHDTFFMYIYDRVIKNIINYSNNQILCYIRGELILPSYKQNMFSMNIGAIKLSKKQENYYLQYFLALGAQWQYLPSERELKVLTKFYKKYYGKKYVKIFIDAIEKNKIRFAK